MSKTVQILQEQLENVGIYYDNDLVRVRSNRNNDDWHPTPVPIVDLALDVVYGDWGKYMEQNMYDYAVNNGDIVKIKKSLWELRRMNVSPGVPTQQMKTLEMEMGQVKPTFTTGGAFGAVTAPESTYSVDEEHLLKLYTAIGIRFRDGFSKVLVRGPSLNLMWVTTPSLESIGLNMLTDNQFEYLDREYFLKDDDDRMVSLRSVYNKLYNTASALSSSSRSDNAAAAFSGPTAMSSKVSVKNPMEEPKSMAPSTSLSSSPPPSRMVVTTRQTAPGKSTFVDNVHKFPYLETTKPGTTAQGEDYNKRIENAIRVHNRTVQPGTFSQVGPRPAVRMYTSLMEEHGPKADMVNNSDNLLDPDPIVVASTKHKPIATEQSQSATAAALSDTLTSISNALSGVRSGFQTVSIMQELSKLAGHSPLMVVRSEQSVNFALTLLGSGPSYTTRAGTTDSTVSALEAAAALSERFNAQSNGQVNDLISCLLHLATASAIAVSKSNLAAWENSLEWLSRGSFEKFGHTGQALSAALTLMSNNLLTTVNLKKLFSESSPVNYKIQHRSLACSVEDVVQFCAWGLGRSDLQPESLQDYRPVVLMWMMRSVVSPVKLLVDIAKSSPSLKQDASFLLLASNYSSDCIWSEMFNYEELRDEFPGVLASDDPLRTAIVTQRDAAVVWRRESPVVLKQLRRSTQPVLLQAMQLYREVLSHNIDPGFLVVLVACVTNA